MTGYATSVIGCDAEAAIERILSPDETPDGRPGVSVLLFAFSRDALEKALANRVGQCVMTCPTSACYNGLPIGEKTIVVGGKLRYFGDGWQNSKKLNDRRFWRIPAMDGEFTCEETFGTTKGVAGGNIILLGDDRGDDPRGRRGRRRRHANRARRDPAVSRRDRPFGLEGRQQIQDAAGQHQHRLRPRHCEASSPRICPPSVECAYEIVIDGLTLEAVEEATAKGIRARVVRGWCKSRRVITEANSARFLFAYWTFLSAIVRRGWRREGAVAGTLVDNWSDHAGDRGPGHPFRHAVGGPCLRPGLADHMGTRDRNQSMARPPI